MNISGIKALKLIFVTTLVFAGGFYGFLAAYYNQNPYYPPVGSETSSKEQMFKAWDWEPSPVWFPSYFLCKIPRNGFGIRHTRSGYVFLAQDERVIYFTASTFIGMAFSVILGMGIRKLIEMKNYTLRRLNYER